MKKVMSAILAACLTLSVSISAFAATTTPSFQTDTGKKLSITVGKTYQFKVTTSNGAKPTFFIPGKAFTVTENGSKDHNFYFTVKAVGKAGEGAGVYIDGQKSPSTTITIVAPIVEKSPTFKVDTGSKITVAQGHTYQFKFTSSSAPAFKLGNNSVFKIASETVQGDNYYLKVKAVGKKGQATGLYVNGDRITICTVS